ncbi:MAG: hypothetical protein WCQ53_03125 [bacterium]
MVLESLASIAKLVVIFTCIALFVLSLVFKIMSGTMYYYYKRDLDLVGGGSGIKDAILVSQKFRPVFKKVNVIPLQEKLIVSSAFSRNSKFKRLLPDGKFRYAIVE